MNIFFLSEDPEEAVRWHVDRHIAKMPTESAQMLSTAHRLLDGKPVVVEYRKFKDAPELSKKTVWLLRDEQVIIKEIPIAQDDGSILLTYTPVAETLNDGPLCWQAAHINHPLTQWTMASSTNYAWHLEFYRTLLAEHGYRYPHSVLHGAGDVLEYVSRSPKNIEAGIFYHPPPSMPDHFKVDSVVESYRRYYAAAKWYFARWTVRDIPPWFLPTMKDVWVLDRANRIQEFFYLMKKGVIPIDPILWVTAKELMRPEDLQGAT